MPRDNRLDLFVTITDFYGYDRQIAIEDPRLVHDQRHRHALTFTYGPGTRDQFQREEQRRARVRRPRDLVLPGRLPAGELQGVPAVGAEGATSAT